MAAVQLGFPPAGPTLALPPGARTLPLVLLEGDFVKKDSIANVESEIARHVVPKKTAYAFRAGDLLFIDARTAADAPAAGRIRIYISDPREVTKIKVADDDASVFRASRTDITLMPRWPFGVSLETDQILIITFEGADVVDDAKLKITIKGVQVVSA